MHLAKTIMCSATGQDLYECPRISRKSGLIIETERKKRALVQRN